MTKTKSTEWKKRSIIILSIGFILVIFITSMFLSGCQKSLSQKAKISYNPKKNEFDITYKGLKIMQGQLSLSGSGEGDNSSFEYKTEKATGENGALTQRFIFSVKKGHSPGIQVTGLFHGHKAFPCSPEKRENLTKIIRVSSGMSKSLLNTGIYSSGDDWALFFPDNSNLAIGYKEGDEDTRTFSFTKQGEQSITLIFKPDFYTQHLDHPYYNTETAHKKKTVPCGWISWKAYGGGITERDVKKVTDWCAEHLIEYGLEYIIIDDGWFKGGAPSGQMYNVPRHVDWTKANNKFPSGIKNLTDYIHQHNLKAGIWISPFGFSGDPETNPGYWIRTGAKGKFLYNEWHGFHYCDGTNKEAAETWLTRGVKAQRKNGIDLFKFDGMYHVAYEGYKNTGNYFSSKGFTWQKALRMGWNELYNSADGSYVLSCWGRVPEIAGIPNAIRIGQDKDSKWIYIPIVAEDLRKYLFEHNIIWCDDPDHMVFRDLSNAESRTWATLVGITGTLLTFSDKPETMTEEKLTILQRILPVINNPAVTPLNLFSYDSPPLLWAMEINRDFDNWIVVANCAINSSINEISFKTLGLDPGQDYTVFDFWNREFRGVYKKSFFSGRPPSHDSTVYGIKKLRPYPWVIAVDRHISQGGISIRHIEYDSDRLKGIVRVVRNDPYTLYVYTHGRKIKEVKTNPDISVNTTIIGYCAVITFTSLTSGEVTWNILFGEKDPDLVPLDNTELNPALSEAVKAFKSKTKDGGLYLSNIEWKSSQNGWGPVEKDMSNGESAEGDGKVMKIDGNTFTKGLGTHAESKIVYSLNKEFSRFKSIIGIDDETSSTGSVIFQVFADNKKLYQSGLVKGGDAPQEVDVDISGKNELTLVVTGAGDGITSDHANWAEARVVP